MCFRQPSPSPTPYSLFDTGNPLFYSNKIVVLIMKTILKFRLIIIIFFILTAEYALAEETINWFVIQLPPSMVLDESGKKITGGAAGKVLLMLQSELKEYAHNNVQMNWARFWNDKANDIYKNHFIHSGLE